MKAKKQKNVRLTIKHKKSLLAGIIIFMFALVCIYGIPKARYYRDGMRQAHIVQIRELIMMAVENLKKTAPVDPKTGDVYFPESRLYLPRPDYALDISYRQDTGDISDANGELTISTKSVFGSTKMYSANSIDDLFKQVPKLQACARGVKIVSQKFDASDSTNELKHTVTLGNGQTKYIYLEKDCPELEPLADALKNLRAY